MGWKEVVVTGVQLRVVFTKPPIGPVVPGVLVELPTPAEDCPVPAGVLGVRAYYPRSKGQTCRVKSSQGIGKVPLPSVEPHESSNVSGS